MAKKKETYPGVAEGPDAEHQAKMDARTLMDAQEIRDDKKRYEAAMACMKDKAKQADTAHKLETKVKAGLAGVFHNSEGY
jgi:hypothetical protein